jgi:BirA family biotin operon repressor/biotin-[acetyl-CoA-carboxylase] ligase
VDAEDPQRGTARMVITRASCPSTQDIVREEGLAGAPAGTVCVTDHQTAGRGRRGRTRTDPPGTAVMFSYLARPARRPDALGPLPLVVGIALAEALPLDVGLRWPNDLVLGAGKLGGILVELVTPPDGPPFAIVGVGINANLTAEQLPPTDRLPATSLLVEGGEPVDRVALLERLLAALDGALADFDRDGFAPFLPRWEARDRLRGRRLELRIGGRAVPGTAGGVDVDGRLLLDGDPYAAGEVERVHG